LVGQTEYTVNNSHEFVQDITSTTLANDECMVSFDVVSLFTKIPVELAITVALERLVADETLHERTDLTSSDVGNALELCLKAIQLTYNGLFYQQIYGTAMGSPISVTVANLVMETVEQKALTTFINPPRFWKRFVDDTNVIIQEDIVEEFFEHINSIEPSIKFTMERESNNSIAFLDTRITRKSNGSLIATVYRKPTHTNRYLNFRSDHPLKDKRAVVRTLHHRAEVLITNKSDRKREIRTINSALRRNGYPDWIFNSQTGRKNTADSNSDDTATITTNQYKGFVTLPYVSGFTDKFKRILENYKIKVAIKPLRTVKDILPSQKDRLDPIKKTGVVYEIPCVDCDQVYIGETGRSFYTRRREHIRDVEIKLDSTKSALSYHAITLEHSIDWDNSKTIEVEQDWGRRRFLESYHIEHSNSMNSKEHHLFPRAYLNLR
jgi:hypothetical protein